MSRPRACLRCGGYECTIECETTLERIERAYYGSAGGSTVLDNADLAFLLRIARAAERLADAQDDVSAVGVTEHEQGDVDEMHKLLCARDAAMDAIRAALEGREP